MRSQIPLGSVMEFVKKSQQKIWTCAALLHHDNAPAHTSLKTTEFVANNNMVIVPHPPYSPYSLWFRVVSQIENETEGTAF
jgi:hypothetical protein